MQKLSEEEYKDPTFKKKLKSGGWRVCKTTSKDGSGSYEAIFEEFNEQRIRQEIIQSDLRPSIPSHAGPFFAALIPRLWCKDPKQRLSAQETAALIEDECQKENVNVPEVADGDEESDEEIQVIDRSAPSIRRTGGRRLLLMRKNGEKSISKSTNGERSVDGKKVKLVEVRDLERSIELVPTRSETLSTIFPQLHHGALQLKCLAVSFLSDFRFGQDRPNAEVRGRCHDETRPEYH